MKAHASSSNSHSASSSSSGAVYHEISYQYDSRTRRTRKSNGAETRDYYYDSQWRAIEERVAGSVAAQYSWSPLDRWTMIRRKRGGEELYVLKDYLDPAAIIDTSGTVVERFGYDAFGPARFMDAAFATLPASNADWNFLFHAEFLDTDSGLYNYGYRYYNPQIGRWISRDPIGERGGINLYGFVGNNGVNKLDFFGKFSFAVPSFAKVFCCCLGDVQYYLDGAKKIKQMYKECGDEKNLDGTDKNKTEKDIDDCVNRKYNEEWGVDKNIGGETDGETMTIYPTSGKCGFIQDQATKIHEDVHVPQMTGGNRDEWTAKETVAFEMEAHSAEITYLEMVLIGLKIVCK